jgi:hexosaminidase
LSDAIQVIPRPAQLTRVEGQYEFSAQVCIFVDPAAPHVAEALLRLLGPSVGVRGLRAEPVSGNGAGGITLSIDGSRREALGEEGYELRVETTGVRGVAATSTGLFWAVQTFRQLLPAAVESSADADKKGWSVPCCHIVDRPRFSWRGAHLDVCRHFFGVEEVKQYIDLLALYKQNVFHWHLTEDQGWRLQIEKHPGLTDQGAWRTKQDGSRYGGFYTQAQAREIVAYGQARSVTVVPEIELPGHALAALTAYPELSCTGGPFQVTGEWGVFEDVYCAGNDKALGLLRDVFDEVIDIFPSRFIHVGGDECPKTRWAKCPACQQRIRDEGLTNEHELQSWFVRQFDQYLTEKGRRLIGWDEILEGGLAPGAAVMSWRGTEGGIAAAQAGHDVVMTPHRHVYFDYKHKDGEQEPGRLGINSLETCYAFDPLPPDLTAEQSVHILGAQGNVWSEGMSDWPAVQQLVWPRMCAVAEMVWSPQADRDFADFVERLRSHGPRMEALGVNYYRDETVWA